MRKLSRHPKSAYTFRSAVNSGYHRTLYKAWLSSPPLLRKEPALDFVYGAGVCILYPRMGALSTNHSVSGVGRMG